MHAAFLQRSTDWHWPPSNVDFCESNHVASPFVAELVNTLSSLPLVAAGAFATHLAISERYGTRFVLCSLAMLLTGVGSAAFHASLLFASQLLDELSMVATVCAFLAALAVEPEAGAKGRQRRTAQRCRNDWRRLVVPLAAALYMLAFGASYVLVAREAHSFFVLPFCGLVCLLFYRARRAIMAVADEGGTLQRMLASVLVTSGIAFFLFWLPDRVLCAQLWPLHLHAAWHLAGVAPPLWLLAALTAELHARRVRQRLGLITDLATGTTTPQPPAPASTLKTAVDGDPEDEAALDAADAAEAAAAGPPRAPRLEWLGCGVARVPVVRLALVRVAEECAPPR